MNGDEGQLIVFCQEEKAWKHSGLFTIADQVQWEKAIFYSGSVHEDDIWERAGFERNLQKGENPGARMLNAFKLGFKRHYQQIVLIRHECTDLNVGLVEEAFYELRSNAVVIGPTFNSDYYLIGMNHLVPEVFSNKEWGTENVLLDTLIDLKKLNCTFKLLKTLL
jgi:glycosyltransferase A (GT-A) superfamily protein (DUF2064 family)